MKVSKSFKNQIDSQKKSGQALENTKLLEHKDFGPYIETLARNSPEWGDLRQHEWVYQEVNSAGGNVNVYFRHVGDGTTRGLSFAQDRVMEDLYKAEAEGEAEEAPKKSEVKAEAPKSTESKSSNAPKTSN